jgi:hypothetical protein
MEYIRITPDLDIQWGDLTLKVDFVHRFTLRDVLRAAVSSSCVPVNVMSDLVHCEFIQDLWDECNESPYCPVCPERVEFLQLSWSAETFYLEDGTEWHNSFWDFKGSNYDNKSEMGIDMSPMYNLADLPIRACNDIELRKFRDDDVQVQSFHVQPSLTLLDLMYWIYWHLGLFGGPKDRDDRINEFIEAIRSVYDGKNGPVVAPLKRNLKEE